MIYDIILFLFIVSSSAAISYFLDYALGQPGHDDIEKINPKSVLFGWTYYLSKRRLNKVECDFDEQKYLEHMEIGFIPAQSNEDCVIRKQAENQMKSDIVGKARHLFCWEMATGMCMFCTNFWISLIICLMFLAIRPVHFIYLPQYFIFLLPFFSHFILRKI